LIERALNAALTPEGLPDPCKRTVRITKGLDRGAGFCFHHQNGPTDPNDEVMLILLMGRFEDRREEHASRPEKTTEVQFDLLLQDLVAPPEEALPCCAGGEVAFVARQHGQEELVRQWAHRSIVVNPIERPLLGKVHFSWIGEFTHLAAPDGEQRPEGGCRI
jgi:hypothetical protein